MKEKLFERKHWENWLTNTKVRWDLKLYLCQTNTWEIHKYKQRISANTMKGCTFSPSQMFLDDFWRISQFFFFFWSGNSFTLKSNYIDRHKYNFNTLRTKQKEIFFLQFFLFLNGRRHNNGEEKPLEWNFLLKNFSFLHSFFSFFVKQNNNRKKSSLKTDIFVFFFLYFVGVWKLINFKNIDFLFFVSQEYQADLKWKTSVSVTRCVKYESTMMLMMMMRMKARVEKWKLRNIFQVRTNKPTFFCRFIKLRWCPWIRLIHHQKQDFLSQLLIEMMPDFHSLASLFNEWKKRYKKKKTSREIQARKSEWEKHLKMSEGKRL